MATLVRARDLPVLAAGHHLWRAASSSLSAPAAPSPSTGSKWKRRHRRSRAQRTRCRRRRCRLLLNVGARRRHSTTLQEPPLGEAGASEDLGFFFRRLGEVCFSAAAEQVYPGPAAALAVASRAGAAFFSDAEGELQRG